MWSWPPLPGSIESCTSRGPKFINGQVAIFNWCFSIFVTILHFQINKYIYITIYIYNSIYIDGVDGWFLWDVYSDSSWLHEWLKPDLVAACNQGAKGISAFFVVLGRRFGPCLLPSGLHLCNFFRKTLNNGWSKPQSRDQAPWCLNSPGKSRKHLQVEISVSENGGFSLKMLI